MKLKELEMILNALADKTRVRILNLLCAGELCVCDVMQVLGEPQSKVSRHLAYLRKTKLVEARKEGLWMYYRLSQLSLKLFRAILKAFEDCQCDLEELEKDLSIFRKNKKSLVTCCK